MPRKLLLFAVIAVVGSMLALWLLTRNKTSESSASTATKDELVAKDFSTEQDLVLHFAQSHPGYSPPAAR